MLAVLAGSGAYLWTQGSALSTTMRIGIFVFVAVGWVVSLCLHEFAHAATAWKGGDRTVEARGYLTLDPRRYMNRQLSIVLPIIIVLIGGIGLPGGAVMIDRRLIPSRGGRSLVAAAGPITNALCAVVCAAPLEFHWVGRGHEALASALAFLALLQVAVTVLNSLPIPGLDGFAILAPYLPEDTVQALMPIANYIFIGLFVVLLYSASAGNAFFNFCYHLAADLGVNRNLAEDGRVLFTFWRHV